MPQESRSKKFHCEDNCPASVGVDLTVSCPCPEQALRLSVQETADFKPIPKLTLAVNSSSIGASFNGPNSLKEFGLVGSMLAVLRWLFLVVLGCFQTHSQPLLTRAVPKHPQDDSASPYFKAALRKVSSSTLDSDRSVKDSQEMDVSLNYKVEKVAHPIHSVFSSLSMRHSKASQHSGKFHQPTNGSNTQFKEFVVEKEQQTVANQLLKGLTSKSEPWLSGALQSLIKAKLSVAGEPAQQLSKFEPETGRFETTFKVAQVYSPDRVYLAQHLLEDRLYIIKKMQLPGTLNGSRQQDEVRRTLSAIQSLHHPNIAKYVTAWVEEECDTVEVNFKRNYRPKNAKVTSKACAVSARQIVAGDSQITLPTLADINKAIFPTTSKSDIEVQFGCVKVSANQTENSTEQTTALNGSFSGSDDGSVVNRSSLKLYLQFEFCNGLSINSWKLSSGLTLEDVEVFGIFSQVLEAVIHVHHQGHTVGKLTTDNIFISEDGSVKLCDFLSSKLNSVNQKNHHSHDLLELGLLIYDLLSSFQTTHERVTALNEVRKSRELSDEFTSKHQSASKLIKLLISNETKISSLEEVRQLCIFKTWEIEASQALFKA